MGLDAIVQELHQTAEKLTTNVNRFVRIASLWHEAVGEPLDGPAYETYRINIAAFTKTYAESVGLEVETLSQGVKSYLKYRAGEGCAT